MLDDLREALERALAICEDAASMQCDCAGYYTCNGCQNRIAERASDAVDVLREALAAPSSPVREWRCVARGVHEDVPILGRGDEASVKDLALRRNHVRGPRGARFIAQHREVGPWVDVPTEEGRDA